MFNLSIFEQLLISRQVVFTTIAATIHCAKKLFWSYMHLPLCTYPWKSAQETDLSIHVSFKNERQWTHLSPCTYHPWWSALSSTSDLDLLISFLIASTTTLQIFSEKALSNVKHSALQHLPHLVNVRFLHLRQTCKRYRWVRLIFPPTKCFQCHGLESGMAGQWRDANANGWQLKYLSNFARRGNQDFHNRFIQS